MLAAPRAPAGPGERRAITLRELVWKHVAIVGLLHVGCVAAPRTFSWGALAVAALLWWLSGGLGICLGYHRLLAHRSFRTSRAVTAALTTLGALSWQGSPILWVGKHRLHHRHSDTPLDPHSPLSGFFWSHMGWVFVQSDDNAERAAARDLQGDPLMRWFDRYHFVLQLPLGVGLFLLGSLWEGNGVGFLVWGVVVRLVFSYHAAWCVNSVTHCVGYRNYETGDGSRNVWWVALITFGEGWHNNHHASQRAAAHGRRWFEVDLTYWTICALERCGLARDVVTPRAFGA